MQSKRIELELFCELGEEEIQSRQSLLIQTLAERDDVDAERAAKAKQYRDKLTALDERQRKLRGVIRDRSEYRLVPCEVRYHVPREGVKRITRMDTGEVVREEDMTSGECQLNIFASVGELEKLCRDLGEVITIEEVSPDDDDDADAERDDKSGDGAE